MPIERGFNIGIALANNYWRIETMNRGWKKSWAYPVTVLFLNLWGHLKRSRQIKGMGRRKHLRAPVSIKVTRVSSGSFSYYHTHDISVGGLFLKSLEPAPAGTELHLRFSLFSGADEIEAEGVVAWAQALEDGSQHPAGMGVKFTKLGDEAQDAIAAFVDLKL
jgi:uncharacterized protein (TIGR02266 family)